MRESHSSLLPNKDLSPDQAHLLGKMLLEEGGFSRLSAHDQALICAIAHRVHVTQDANEAFESQTTFGQRLADRVAEVGGSWGFVISFVIFLILWAGLNVVVLHGQDRFDPYPFIFLNLILSMLAAIQAPIIMMAQNRQADKDRLTTRMDYEVNVKAEHEIALLREHVSQLHDKLDRHLAGAA